MDFIIKKILDWQSKDVVNIFDEVNLWSAPFGKLLLENIPMRPGMTVVDIGFGTGFPLVELAQRFGEKSKIIGIDIWKEAVARTKEKIKILELENIEINEQNAINIDILDNTVDLVTSNLGINNFENRTKVYTEIYRILKPEGRLAITTNPIGTFEELFNLFEGILKILGTADDVEQFKNYLSNRSKEEEIIKEFEKSNLKFMKSKSEKTNIRFATAEAVLNHSLIRCGFKAGWNQFLRLEIRTTFYEMLSEKINQTIKNKGEFKMSIPMLYLEFRK